MNNGYEDIIHLPYPFPSTRKRMSMADRAAQFSPFAALVGYEETIDETARLTDHRIELDENEKEMLDIQQQQLIRQAQSQPLITVTYFCPDAHKEGGQYVAVTGNFKAILPHIGILKLTDGREIPLREIIRLDITDP